MAAVFNSSRTVVKAFIRGTPCIPSLSAVKGNATDMVGIRRPRLRVTTPCVALLFSTQHYISLIFPSTDWCLHVCNSDSYIETK